MKHLRSDSSGTSSASTLVVATLLAMGGATATGAALVTDEPPSWAYEFLGYRVGVLNPDELRDAARHGTPVHVGFGEESFLVSLRLHNMRAEGMQAGYVDDNGTFHPVDLPPPSTYRGHVLHENGTVNTSTNLAWTITDDGVTGSISDENGAWFLRPSERHAPKEGEIVHLLHRDGRTGVGAILGRLEAAWL